MGRTGSRTLNAGKRCAYVYLLLHVHHLAGRRPIPKHFVSTTAVAHNLSGVGVDQVVNDIPAC